MMHRQARGLFVELRRRLQGLLLLGFLGMIAHEGLAQNAQQSVIATDWGSWQETMFCELRCQSNYLFWVELDVQAPSEPFEVGLRYRVVWADHEEPDRVAYARFRNQLGEGRQRWAIDISAAVGAERPLEIVFQPFLDTGSQQIEDAHRYHVYQAVSPRAPVRLLEGSRVRYDPERGAVLEGVVRIFDFLVEKAVYLRYSVDGWDTALEAELMPATSGDWPFAVVISKPGDELPLAVEYVPRYHIPGKEYWYNGPGGGNFKRRLRPDFRVSLASFDPLQSLESLAGEFHVDVDLNTDLPVETIAIRIDEGPWDVQKTLSFSTASMQDGMHTLEFRAALEGGYIAEHRIPFGVHNRLYQAQIWDLSPSMREEGPALDMAVDPVGGLVILRQDGALEHRRSERGQIRETLRFVEANVEKISFDTLGRLYTLDGQQVVRRYHLDGRLDLSFAESGQLDLRRPGQGGLACPVKDLSHNRQHLFILDSCQARVLRFDERGLYRGTFRLVTAPGEWLEGLFAEEGQVWLLSNQRLLVLRDGPGDRALVLERQSSFAGTISWRQPRGFVRDRNGTFWVVDAYARLVGFDEQTNILVSWYHPSTEVGSPEDLIHLVRLVALPSGDLAVLSQAGRYLQIFRSHGRR